MKVTNFKDELQRLDHAQLREKLEQLRRELFGLRLNVITAHVKDHSQFKKLRRNIARVLTCIRQKEKDQGAQG